MYIFSILLGQSYVEVWTVWLS